mmetsp:Transcript_30951/g.74700  ORF Transcript_30951/g.74700 Transcript_30951/m.74700 type:complete len:363 (+) Transcript_30951:477-1565(+)
MSSSSRMPGPFPTKKPLRPASDGDGPPLVNQAGLLADASTELVLLILASLTVSGCKCPAEAECCAAGVAASLCTPSSRLAPAAGRSKTTCTRPDASLPLSPFALECEALSRGIPRAAASRLSIHLTRSREDSAAMTNLVAFGPPWRIAIAGNKSMRNAWRPALALLHSRTLQPFGISTLFSGLVCQHDKPCASVTDTLNLSHRPLPSSTSSHPSISLAASPHCLFSSVSSAFDAAPVPPSPLYSASHFSGFSPSFAMNLSMQMSSLRPGGGSCLSAACIKLRALVTQMLPFLPPVPASSQSIAVSAADGTSHACGTHRISLGEGSSGLVVHTIPSAAKSCEGGTPRQTNTLESPDVFDQASL